MAASSALLTNLRKLAAGGKWRVSYVIGTPVPPEYDDDLAATFRQVRRHTLTSAARWPRCATASSTSCSNDIEGDIAECGVWKGGSMMAAALTLLRLGDTSRAPLPLRHLRGDDRSPPRRTSAPPTTATRRTSGGSASRARAAAWAGVAVAEVQAAIESTGYPTDQIHCIAGKVEDTIPAQSPPERDRPPAARHRLVRVDQARARAPLPAPRRRRRADHRRLRPLRGRPQGRRRVLRRAPARPCSSTASTTRAGWPIKTGPRRARRHERRRASSGCSASPPRSSTRRTSSRPSTSGCAPRSRASTSSSCSSTTAPPTARRSCWPSWPSRTRVSASSSCPGTSATRPPWRPASTTAAATPSSRSTPTCRTRRSSSPSSSRSGRTAPTSSTPPAATARARAGSSW